MKDALLPDYKKCGQAKKKDSNELNKILEIVFKEHNRAKGKRTLKYSWKKMKMDYFAGSPESEIPSYGQFTKRYRDAFKKSERERVIVGDKKYRKDISPNLSNSTLESNAPGKRYQIDATIADVHIVSEFDRADSISRPTVYLCIDVFSRMIAGVYIGLESPSMEGARMTILNCIEDKEEYCSRYDYSMSKDDWPVRSLPSNLLGDNAELRGLTVENAIMKLGIAIENTGSYRGGDMKGIVERKFRSLHDRIKAVVKGMIMPDFQERGAPDYRKEARLTISEFSRIVFAWIKEEHNKYLQNYPPDIEIEKAGINKTPPLELWKWGGAQYRPQFLKTAPEMVVRAALLPSKMASVTQNGIRLHRHVHYTCDIAIKEDWFIRAKHNKSKMKVQLMFNKRNLREAYIYYKGEYLPVLPTINSDILKYSYEELLYIDKAEKKRKKAYENKEFQAFVNSEKEMQEIVRDADYLSGINSSSAKVNVTNVKENREIEKAAIKHLQKETPEVTVDQEVVESDTTTENDPILDAIRAISKKKKGRKDG